MSREAAARSGVTYSLKSRVVIAGRWHMGCRGLGREEASSVLRLLMSSTYLLTMRLLVRVSKESISTEQYCSQNGLTNYFPKAGNYRSGRCPPSRASSSVAGGLFTGKNL